MLLKSDGTGLYATKDLELAKRKFRDFQIERSVYVVDVRQALHFAQVFKVLEKLGFEQAKNCVHLQYNFVELPDGPMSSRKGNIIAVTDLIQKMNSMIQEKYLAKYKGNWSPEEIELVSNQVSLGAIKYGMLRIDTAKKIVFDMEEWLKIDGESGPFIQYSAARIKSLLRKLRDSTLGYQADWSHLKQEAELNLISQGLYFRTVIKNAAIQEKPHLVTNYLYELAKAFNYFYHECPIASAETIEIKVARLELAQVTGKLLEKGLELLGIPTPERM
jgi:arginyl-tRNA synthetase